MENNSFNQFVDAVYVFGASRVEPKDVIYEHHGHLVMPIWKLGFLGGNLTQMGPDESGKIRFKNLIISPLLYCGHVLTSINQLGGRCHVCGHLTCRECLRMCDLSGVSVCLKHSTVTSKGIVVSVHAQKGLWKLKALREARKMQGLSYGGKKKITGPGK
jgi:hypothetical protein